MTTTDKFKGVIYVQAIGDALDFGTDGITTEDMVWKCPNGILAYKGMNNIQA